MFKFRSLVAGCLFFQQFTAFAQPTPPCGNDYGSSADEDAIIFAMRFGSTADALNAIQAAKETRGTALGCPQTAMTYSPGDYSQPVLSEVENVWTTNHLPVIEGYVIDCPEVGRYSNNDALGAYYAMLAGYPVSLTALSAVGNMMEAQQFTESNSTIVDSEHEGVYAFIHVGSFDPCYPGGVVGSTVDAVCSAAPSLCKEYDLGLFAGEEFLVADQYEPLDFYDGGIAYDHGWVGVQMIEASIQQLDSDIQGKFKNSVELAANWAINEKEVKNHNYTAKLIWLLAQMYEWSGLDIYKDELNRKLDKNLLPGVLTDFDSDGYVDNISTSILFSDLTEVAQLPGRMWDGHNSLPWYGAMNAWALTDAYVAFRSRGDVTRASELKPYVLMMLDNLSWEINNLGVVPDQLGIRDMAYALLNGIWKVAQYEDESHPEWESAAWALWNAGYFDNYSTHSVCLGLYLIVLSETPYVPLHDRLEFDSISSIAPLNTIKLYPNPVVDELTLEFDQFDNGPKMIEFYDAQGKLILTKEASKSPVNIGINLLNQGVYTVSIRDVESREVLWRTKFVAQ